MIRIGILGLGHWGPNHLRTFSSLPECAVLKAADLQPSRLRALAPSYPQTDFVSDAREVLNGDSVDAVVIATPTGSHFKLAHAALSAGKDVLCEKPLTLTARESRTLMELARSRGRILMVGHVFLFNPGILWLKSYLDSGGAGRVLYVHATRTNLGPIRSDVNAAFDLASHDISILNFLLGGEPIAVNATGQSFLSPRVEDVVFVSLLYPGDVLANVHVSWLDPKKVREITVIGEKRMVVWNDLSAEGPITVYDKGVIREPYYSDYGEFNLLVRQGEISIPYVKQYEPVRAQAVHFVDCIKERKTPRTDGEDGLAVVRVLEAVEKSLSAGGRRVELRERARKRRR
ncbi:MAG: Gfo/Idh/MocA family oxidoreductase [Acidobacteria bacterium]|nr:Gfo/Idh/MocA family oxidoreductase [Acidobacteriota bacterium]